MLKMLLPGNTRANSSNTSFKYRIVNHILNTNLEIPLIHEHLLRINILISYKMNVMITKYLLFEYLLN